MVMEKELFALLRLGLGTSTAGNENLSDFIMLPAAQWKRIGDLSRAQGVLGIALDGVDQLEVSKCGATRNLPVSQKLEWIGEVLSIEQANQHQMAVMNEMAEKWLDLGCRVMVMKGQANGAMYPKPEHRNPGDIDCYLMPGSRFMAEPSGRAERMFHDSCSNDQQAEAYKRGNEIARVAGAKVDESWYKHSVISYKGETFENHQFFVHTRDGKRGKQLNQELVEGLKVQDSSFTVQGDVIFPPVQWNAMFLTYHACAHFVSEGLRLKQILDWVMFLKVHQDDVDWPAFYAYCERNHLRRFADAMTTIAVKYLGIKVTQKSQINTDSPYAEKILHNALYEDDYVFSSGESSWTNRWHIVKNLFKYRWKYEEIYQQSVWKQLWWYASGFILHTENE